MAQDGVPQNVDECLADAFASVHYAENRLIDAQASLEKVLQRFAVLTGVVARPGANRDLPVPVAESPGAVRIGRPERSHLVEYLAPNSVFNSLPRSNVRVRISGPMIAL